MIFSKHVALPYHYMANSNDRLLYVFEEGDPLVSLLSMGITTTANHPVIEDFGFATRWGDTLVLGVCDGMGGKPNGDKASSWAAHDMMALLQDPQFAPKPWDLGPQILELGQTLIQRFLAKATSRCGTTLCMTVVRVNEDKSMTLYTLNFGDSGAYVATPTDTQTISLMNHKPSAPRCLETHSPEFLHYYDENQLAMSTIAHPDDLQDASIETQIQFRQRNLVTNALNGQESGIPDDIPTPIVYIKHLPYPELERATLFCASDGVLDNLTRDQMTEAIKKGGVDNLVLQAIETSQAHNTRSKRDDICVVSCLLGVVNKAMRHKFPPGVHPHVLIDDYFT
ncbi:MAG: PP2C family serine/threonine-protein phosphatase [Candidatus Margulisiibacteriota bacterium]